jgi:predicted Zn-dependent peptidase
MIGGEWRMEQTRRERLAILLANSKDGIYADPDEAAYLAQKLIEALDVLEEIAQAGIPQHGSPDSWAINMARQFLEGGDTMKMTDNERIQERLYEVWKELNGGFDLPNKDGRFLYEQIEQQDKTIAELKAEIKRIQVGSEKWTEIASSWQREALSQKKENKLMLSALERIVEIGNIPCSDDQYIEMVDSIARETFARVKGGE